MSNVWFQESSDWKPWHVMRVLYIFMN